MFNVADGFKASLMFFSYQKGTLICVGMKIKSEMKVEMEMIRQG